MHKYSKASGQRVTVEKGSIKTMHLETAILGDAREGTRSPDPGQGKKAMHRAKVACSGRQYLSTCAVNDLSFELVLLHVFGTRHVTSILATGQDHGPSFLGLKILRDCHSIQGAIQLKCR